MRFVTLRTDSGQDQVARWIGDKLHVMRGVPSLLSLLGDDGERLMRAGEAAERDPAAVIPFASAHIKAPIPQPPTIRDFYAFEQHVVAGRRSRGLEMIKEWYELPVFYFTNPSSLAGHGDSVAVPPGCQKLDFELEVAAVVGRRGENLTVAEASRHIVGYMLMNDWSARDLQRKDFRSSFGPALVTADELQPLRKGQAFDISLTATVNGREYSRDTLANIYWSFEEMLSFASRGTVVNPGDVLGSGTCGTGCISELSLTHGEDKYPWLKPGDRVEFKADILGTLANTIVAGPPLHPLR